MRNPKPANNTAEKCGSKKIIDTATRLLLKGAHAEASSLLRSALLRFPADARLLIRHADALYQAGNVTQALQTYRDAIAIERMEFQAWYGCGVAEFSMGAYGNSLECFREALTLSPNDADAHLYLAKSLLNLGDTDTAIRHLNLAADHGDSSTRLKALKDIAVFIPGSPAHDNAFVLQARRAWAATHEETFKPSRMGPQASGLGRIRVGYVSSFFDCCNWMKPLWGLINDHDRSEFEIHLFADGSEPTPESGYARDERDVVHDITDLTNERAAQEIELAEIDILVDLSGYSAPQRLGIFVSRPAPTIVSCFGMYATTGIPAFDYLIGDPVVMPVEDEHLYTDKILRVSQCYLAFSVLYPVPAVAPAPSVVTDRITFGSLAPQYKLNSQVISAYGEILRAAPNARVIFKSVSLGDASNRRWLYQHFAECGIPADRIEVEGPAEHSEFLRTYDRIDIALDTFPYNGGTTTMEALWQGVPVLTFSGDRWSSRISSSLLRAAGLPEWVMPTRDAFVQRAVELATDRRTPARLNELRTGMRPCLARSALCDTQLLCRETEQLYKKIHRDAQDRR